jgi:hypothetical protein
MRDTHVREQRKAMLPRLHMVDLASYAQSLRKTGVEVPDFDPLDGGVRAQVLFLFEKPGPMTAEKGSGNRSGSGFISRDNDDPTAEAIWRFMREADIPRDLNGSLERDSLVERHPGGGKRGTEEGCEPCYGADATTIRVARSRARRQESWQSTIISSDQASAPLHVISSIPSGEGSLAGKVERHSDRVGEGHPLHSGDG